MSCISSTDGLPITAAESWADTLAVGNVSGGTNPTISAGDSIIGLGDLPITVGAFTTTYVLATGLWTYPASATYASASPIVTIGAGTGSPALVLNQSADETGTIQIQNAGGDRGRFYFGQGDPAIAANNGDVYFDLENTNDTLWKYTGGAWANVTGGGAAATWAQTLAAGAVSGGNSPTLSNGDDLLVAVNLGSDIGAAGTSFQRAFVSHQAGGVAIVGDANFNADDETFINIDTGAAGTNTITLPAAVTGYWYIIDIDFTPNGTVALDDQPGDTINGGAGPINLYVGGAGNQRSVWLVYAQNGTNWVAKSITVLP